MKNIILKASCDSSDTAWEVPQHLLRDVDASEFNPFYQDMAVYLGSLLTVEYIEQILPFMNFTKLNENMRVACYACILMNYSHRIAGLSIAADILGFISNMKSNDRTH